MRVHALALLVPQPPQALQVGSGRGKLSGKEQGGPQRVVSLQEERRIVDLLGQAQEPLPQRPRPLVLAAVLYSRQRPHSTGKSCGVSPTCWHNSCARAYACSTAGAAEPL